MKKNLLLLVLVSSLFFLFSQLGTAQVNEYSLAPTDIKIGFGDSTVQVDIYINTLDDILAFLVPLYAEGTSNPVLDTILTGTPYNPNSPAFDPPSLVSAFSTRYVNPYGPPTDPLLFFAHNFATSLPPSSGLYCRMFYKVSGPGTLTFRTAVHSTTGAVGMWREDATRAPINWPSEVEVGSFEVIAVLCGDANRDGQITVSDVIFLINYFFKNGFSPNPLIAGDANCDGEVTVSDVIYLLNYLFKSGPLPPC